VCPRLHCPDVTAFQRMNSLSPSARLGRPWEVTAVQRHAAEACYTKFNPNRSMGSARKHSFRPSGKLRPHLGRLSLNMSCYTIFFFVQRTPFLSFAHVQRMVSFCITSRTDGQTHSPHKAFHILLDNERE
jgi:hypothetical protein